MKFQLPLPVTGKATRSIGLDIGFHTVKAVELISDESGFTITNFAIREIPPAGLATKDRAGLLADLIKEMFAEHGIKGRSVYCCVSGHNVVIRRTALPKMPMDELVEASRWNAKEEVLFSLETAAIDCYIMGEIEKEGAVYYDLLNVIVRNDIIPFVVSIVEKSGLRIAGVTAIPLTLWDYGNAVSPPPPGATTSYVDMGSERTRIYFISDNRLLFSREIPNGGKNITSALVGRYAAGKGEVAVDEIRAEIIKKTHGFPAENAMGYTREDIPLQEIRARILPVLTKQVEEMYRSMEYFKNQHKKDKVDKLVLSGGAVSLSGLYKFFSENLGGEIERCNVLLQCKTDIPGLDEKDIKLLGPSLTTAAGLALGKCDKINVLPEMYRTSLKKTLIKWAPWTAIPVFMLILLTLSVHFRGKAKALEEKLVVKEAEQVDLQRKAVESKVPLQTLTNLQKAKAELENERNMLPKAPDRSIDIIAVFNLLSRIISPNTSLSKVAYTAPGGGLSPGGGGSAKGGGGAEISLQGNMFGDDDVTLETLTTLMEQLNKSPLFAEAKLIASETVAAEVFTRPGIKFEIFLVPANNKDK